MPPKRVYTPLDGTSGAISRNATELPIQTLSTILDSRRISNSLIIHHSSIIQKINNKYLKINYIINSLGVDNRSARYYIDNRGEKKMKIETIRQKAKSENHISEYAQKEHSRNYHRLYIDHDGSMHWSSEASRDTQLIDNMADDFRAVKSLCCIGTGSIDCNCDWCSGSNAVSDPSEIDYESDALSAIGDILNQAFSEIPIGYFDDEESE